MIPGNEVTHIQCTRSKRDSPHPAHRLYDASGYFQDMKRWAVARDAPWRILSAKHGLVSPDTVLDPYDEFGLSEQQAKTIAQELGRGNVHSVTLCAGSKYTKPLVSALERRGIDVTDSFVGLGIGERRQKLQQRTAELENESLC